MAHESFESDEHTFGLVLAVVFAIIGLLPLAYGRGPHAWVLAVAAAFLAVALAVPSISRRSTGSG